MAANLALFAGRGVDRLNLDLGIRRAPGLAAKRALCWDKPDRSELADQVRSFEEALARMRKEHPSSRGVMVVTPTGSTVFASIARHELFPLPVLLLLRPKEVPDAAAISGADVVLRPDRFGHWQVRARTE